MNLSWAPFVANPFLWGYLVCFSLAICVTNSVRRGIRKKFPGIPSLIFLSLAFLFFALGVFFAPEIVKQSFVQDSWPALTGALVAGILITFFPRTAGIALLFALSGLYAGLFITLNSIPSLRVDDTPTSLFVLRMEDPWTSVELKQPGYSQVYRIYGEEARLHAYGLTVSTFIPFPAERAVFLEAIGGTDPEKRQRVITQGESEMNPFTLKVEKFLRQARIFSLFEVAPASRKLHLLKSYQIEVNHQKSDISSLSFSG